MTPTHFFTVVVNADARGVWIISYEAYEDVRFDDAEHVSPASLPGMYDRTLSFYTFSKTYAMTGLRLGYVAVKDPALRDRMKKVLFYTASNISSIVQYGGIGALEGSQACIAEFRTELQARRDLFYAGVKHKLVVREGKAHGWPTLPQDIPILAEWIDENTKKQ